MAIDHIWVLDRQEGFAAYHYSICQFCLGICLLWAFIVCSSSHCL